MTAVHPAPPVPHPSPTPVADAFPGLAAVMPALDEEGSIGRVIGDLQRLGVRRIVVGDNDSQDRTAEIARGLGAIVVRAHPRGYGSACRAAALAVPEGTTAVLFCDADGADQLEKLPQLAGPVLAGECDLVIGSRVLGRVEPGALTPPQRFGNLLAAALMRWFYGERVTDLGPFRCVSTAALARLDMRDLGYGWTTEMQVKAFRLALRYREVAVDARLRVAGESKISGRIGPVFRAGWAILSTIWRYRRAPLAGAVR
jgi:glycosyltransferase involved in cell wall biosynthesis